jgi:hypothetical protein
MKVVANKKFTGPTIKLQKVWESIGKPGKPTTKERTKLRWQSRPGGVLRTLSETVRDHGERWVWEITDTEELGKVIAVLNGPSPPKGWDRAEYKKGEIPVDA